MTKQIFPGGSGEKKHQCKVFEEPVLFLQEDPQDSSASKLLPPHRPRLLPRLVSLSRAVEERLAARLSLSCSETLPWIDSNTPDMEQQLQHSSTFPLHPHTQTHPPLYWVNHSSWAGHLQPCPHRAARIKHSLVGAPSSVCPKQRLLTGIHHY